MGLPETGSAYINPSLAPVNESDLTNYKFNLNFQGHAGETTGLQQLTIQFIDPGHIETSMNWTAEKSINNDTGMHLISANNTPCDNGQFNIAFRTVQMPGPAGADNICSIFIDKIEVCR